MPMDRRAFLAGGAAAFASAAARTEIIAEGASGAQREALESIAAQVEAHREYTGAPAMAVSLVDGARQFIILSGTRDHGRSQPLTGQELWQIGSISKSFVAVCAMQLHAEGRMGLEDDLRKHLPEAPVLPNAPDAPLTILALLDHVAGLPSGGAHSPMQGTNWRAAYSSGSHWHYSNLGYALVGLAIERVEGRQLAEVLERRVLRPLGMNSSSGSIGWHNRSAHVASFARERADHDWVPGATLAPANWEDVVSGAGCVTATPADMVKYLRWLVGVGNGNGAPLLGPEASRRWLENAVVQDPEKPADRYGRGLMHRIDDSRALLHHTGGMANFVSSMHVDAEGGLGAFASCAIGGVPYRPTALTIYALRALRAAKEGRPIPAASPLTPRVKDPANYAGRYGVFDVSTELVITGEGSSAPLVLTGADSFATSHPALRRFQLVFVRDTGGSVIAFDHGSTRQPREGSAAPPLPPTSDRLRRLSGRYASSLAWAGGVTRVVARGDRLFLGGVTPLVEIERDVWRPEKPEWNPERIRFGGFIAGRPQTLTSAGAAYTRIEDY